MRSPVPDIGSTPVPPIHASLALTTICGCRPYSLAGKTEGTQQILSWHLSIAEVASGEWRYAIEPGGIEKAGCHTRLRMPGAFDTRIKRPGQFKPTGMSIN